MALELVKNSFSTSSIEGVFERIRFLHQQLGLNYREPSAEAYGKFNSLPATRKLEILGHLKIHFDIYSDILNHKIALRDTKGIIRKVLGLLDIRVDESFITEMGQDDLVEIYNSQMIQVFRNYRFFEICGYSLLDLELNSWPELYSRSRLINEKLFEIGRRVLIEQTQAEHLNVEAHYLKELFSETKQVVEIKLKMIAPIYYAKDENRYGFALSQSARIVVDDDISDSITFL